MSIICYTPIKNLKWIVEFAYSWSLKNIYMDADT